MENLSPCISPNERWEYGKFRLSRGLILDFMDGMRWLFQAVPFYSVQDCNRYILNKVNGQFRTPLLPPSGGWGVAVPFYCVQNSWCKADTSLPVSFIFGRGYSTSNRFSLCCNQETLASRRFILMVSTISWHKMAPSSFVSCTVAL